MKKIKLNDSGILFDAESHTYCTKDGEVLQRYEPTKDNAAMRSREYQIGDKNMQRQKARGFTISLNCMMK